MKRLYRELMCRIKGHRVVNAKWDAFFLKPKAASEMGRVEACSRCGALLGSITITMEPPYELDSVVVRTGA